MNVHIRIVHDGCTYCIDSIQLPCGCQTLRARRQNEGGSSNVATLSSDNIGVNNAVQYAQYCHNYPALIRAEHCSKEHHASFIEVCPKNNGVIATDAVTATKPSAKQVPEQTVAMGHNTNFFIKSMNYEKIIRALITKLEKRRKDS